MNIAISSSIQNNQDTDSVEPASRGQDVNSGYNFMQSQASAKPSGQTTVGKKTAFQTLGSAAKVAAKSIRSQLDAESASQDDAWSDNSQQRPPKLQAKGTMQLKDHEEGKRRQNKSRLIGECLNDDVINVLEHDHPKLPQNLIRTITAQGQKEGFSNQRLAMLRPGRHAHRELSIKSNKVKMRSERGGVGGDEDKATVYEYSELGTPDAVAKRRAQNISQIGNVQIMSAQTTSRIQQNYERQTTRVTQQQQPIDELINSVTEEEEQLISPVDQGCNCDQDHLDVSDEFLRVAQKPLPLKKISRKPVYKRSQRVPGAPNGAGSKSVGRNERFPGQHGGSYRINSVVGSNLTPLAIDTRHRQQIFQSPFRQQQQQLQSNQQSMMGKNSRRAFGKKGSTRSSNQKLHGRGSLENPKYDLSPTTTNLLSQTSGRNISIFATSYNQLPSVIAGRNPVTTKTQKNENVKALFKATGNEQSVLTMRAAGSSSYFPPASFIHKEQTKDVSVISLLQRMAQANAKKTFQRVMLNEQSAINLPMDPAIKREMDALQQHAQDENAHIKIMGENFIVQPSVSTMTNHYLNKPSKQENYQVMINSKNNTDDVHTCTDTNNDLESTFKSITSKLASHESLETDQTLVKLNESQAAIPIDILPNPMTNTFGKQRLSMPTSSQHIYNASLVTSPSNSFYSQPPLPSSHNLPNKTFYTERSSTGPSHGQRAALPNLRQRCQQPQGRTFHKRKLTLQQQVRSLMPEVSFGSIERNSGGHAPVPFIENYTYKQKQQIMDMASKAARQSKKVKQKKGLTFKNRMQVEAPQLVSFGGKGEALAPMTEMALRTMGSMQISSDDVTNYRTLSQYKAPLMLQVMSPLSSLPQHPLDRDNDGKQTTITLYPVENGASSQHEIPSPTDPSNKRPLSFGSQKGMRHKFDPSVDDDRESVKIQDGTLFNLHTHGKMQLTVQAPARGILDSQGSHDISNFEKASMMTKIWEKKLDHQDKQSPNHHKKQHMASTTRHLAAPQQSFAHQNSNQNLYSKQVLLKFPHSSTTRKVLMKVGPETKWDDVKQSNRNLNFQDQKSPEASTQKMFHSKSPRRKQVPSIPNRTLNLANDSEAELPNLADLPAELPQSFMSPLAGGHNHAATDSCGLDMSDVAGWVSAKGSSYNPFSTGMKQAEQFSSLDIQSKEIDLEKRQIESDLLTDSRRLLLYQAMAYNQQAQTEALNSPKSLKEEPQSRQMLQPRVTLTSRLSKAAVEEEQETKSPKPGVPMTKKEFLDQYKQAVASSIKEQKKRDKEKKEQKRVILRKRSSAMDLVDDLECAVKTGHWQIQNNMTLELDGGVIDPALLDNPKFLTDAKLKSATIDRRVPNNIYDQNGFGVPMHAIDRAQESASISKINIQEILKDLSSEFTVKVWPQKTGSEGYHLEKVTDSIETQEGMGIIGHTLKLPKEHNLLSPGFAYSDRNRKTNQDIASLDSRDSNFGIVSNPDELPSVQESNKSPKLRQQEIGQEQQVHRDPTPDKGPQPLSLSPLLKQKKNNSPQKPEQDGEEDTQTQLEMARLEFARNKEKAQRQSQPSAQASNSHKGYAMLSAVSSKDIKPLKKGGRVREQHKALHLPKKEYDKTETTVVANNEDIMNLLTPDVQ